MTYQTRWRYQYQRIADVLQQLTERVEDDLWPKAGARRRHDRAHGEQVDGCGECHIRRIVDYAPPLTSEQIDRLRLLLRSGIQKAGQEMQIAASRPVHEVLAAELAESRPA